MKTIATLAVGITIALGSCEKKGSAGSAHQIRHTDITATDTLPLSNWISLSDDSTDYTYSSTITWPTITQDIRDRGLVMAYMKNTTTHAWQALPYSCEADGHSETINYDVNIGLVTITYDGYDPSGSPGASSMNGSITIRLVAVPASARTANPDVDWTNYEKVLTLLDEKN